MDAKRSGLENSREFWPRPLYSTSSPTRSPESHDEEMDMFNGLPLIRPEKCSADESHGAIKGSFSKPIVVVVVVVVVWLYL